MGQPIHIRSPFRPASRFTDLRKRWSRVMATRRALETLDEDIPQPAFDANAGEIQGIMQDMRIRPASDLSTAILKFRVLEFQIVEWVSDNDGPSTAALLPLLASFEADMERLARLAKRHTPAPSTMADLDESGQKAHRPLTNTRNVSHTKP